MVINSFGQFSNFDFTYNKYEKLCETLLKSDLSILTVKDYILMEDKPNKFVIIRHDIDDETDLTYAIRMAKTENKLGFKTSYYFRTCENVFNTDCIKQIEQLGHEIGYHYEVLGETEGDYEKAIELFEVNLNKFKKICDIKTIAQHGGPLRNCLNVVKISNIVQIFKQMIQGKHILDRWESKDMWTKYDYEKYGIIGEPYLSIDFGKIAYLSDTNRSWINTKYRLKDKVNSGVNLKSIKKTDDLIENIKSEKLQKIHILIHPSNWKITLHEWMMWFILQHLRNIGKRILLIMQKDGLNAK